jgi:hypothetical protein
MSRGELDLCYWLGEPKEPPRPKVLPSYRETFYVPRETRFNLPQKKKQKFVSTKKEFTSYKKEFTFQKKQGRLL